ncbi:Clavaminate synthase-like protein [Periconia macrospinosa]|uniref:Clavaminate synthase-like protein n=1 Tax=Periconia macrospinosa TaxID=97972 RepID=A0A2V1E1C8_9PLEO|nr:Clavaminate synthase-like protein [Periconia macrospinosa]
MNDYSDDAHVEESAPGAATSTQAPPPPSLAEITQLTHNELTRRNDDGNRSTNINDDGLITDADSISIRGEEGDADTIQDCGLAALDLLRRNPTLCLDLAYQHLHDVPYKEVRTCWRRLYVDAALWVVLGIVGRLFPVEKGKVNEDRTQEGEKDCGGEPDGGEEKDDWVAEVVKTLDMALILTGAPRREELIELWFSALEGVLASTNNKHQQRKAGQKSTSPHPDDPHHQPPPSKKRKLTTSPTDPIALPPTFPTTLTHSPTLKHPIPISKTPPSLSSFQTKVSNPSTQTPLIIHGAIAHWPALDERPWNSPQYLLSRTLGGRRLVPVEVGRSYTDDGWGQKVISFGEFLRGYMFSHHDEDESMKKDDSKNNKTGYLAQHDLFAQIPSLRSDISIPDYCFTSPCRRRRRRSSSPPTTSTTTINTSSSSSSSAPLPPSLETPLLNAWFGPAHTISPLHTDPYHNILAQVVGYKYIRLYPPSQTPFLYPRGIEDGGVDMSNTSCVDLDVAMCVWGSISCWDGEGQGREGEVEEEKKKKRRTREEYDNKFPTFKNAHYVEGILGPGECLYVPLGWWHYVQSLTASFSVSFWFN